LPCVLGCGIPSNLCVGTLYAGTYCPRLRWRSTVHDFVSQKNAVLIFRPCGHLKSDSASLVSHSERYVYLLPSFPCCFIASCFYSTLAMCHRSPFTKDTWFPFIVRTHSNRYRVTQLFRSFRIIISLRFITVVATAIISRPEVVQYVAKLLQPTANGCRCFTQFLQDRHQNRLRQLPIIFVTMFAINPEARCFVVRVTEVVVNKP
jgi:hypothetical protein